MIFNFLTIRVKTSERLISHDVHSNTFNFKVKIRLQLNSRPMLFLFCFSFPRFIVYFISISILVSSLFAVQNYLCHVSTCTASLAVHIRRGAGADLQGRPCLPPPGRGALARLHDVCTTYLKSLYNTHKHTHIYIYMYNI